ncbi:MAG: hypothetical protein QF464_14265, partial [Myxococcota bacterium]|nr:hypothetical protein [Myxococcota bacterium]
VTDGPIGAIDGEVSWQVAAPFAVTVCAYYQCDDPSTCSFSCTQGAETPLEEETLGAFWGCCGQGISGTVKFDLGSGLFSDESGRMLVSAGHDDATLNMCVELNIVF